MQVLACVSSNFLQAAFVHYIDWFFSWQNPLLLFYLAPNGQSSLLCPIIFDGWRCWPSTKAGETAYVSCPSNQPGFSTERKLTTKSLHISLLNLVPSIDFYRVSCSNVSWRKPYALQERHTKYAPQMELGIGILIQVVIGPITRLALTPTTWLWVSLWELFQETMMRISNQILNLIGANNVLNSFAKR